jgi:hypothetical protein
VIVTILEPVNNWFRISFNRQTRLRECWPPVWASGKGIIGLPLGLYQN